MPEINKIFAVLDAIGVHREHVVIPLATGKGRVRRMPSGKLEIIVDAEDAHRRVAEGPARDDPGGASPVSRAGLRRELASFHCWPSSSST
jgi:hypothetical protein